MKKSLLAAAAATVATILTGCGTMLFNTNNSNETQTKIELSKGNFKVIGNVQGFASASYVFGIGGLSKQATRNNAVADMFKKAHLQNTQTITNIYVKSHISTILGIYTRISFSASGQIIEFVPEYNPTSTRQHATTSDYTESDSENVYTDPKSKYLIGQELTIGGKTGVIFWLSNDRQHGKIVAQDLIPETQWCTKNHKTKTYAQDEDDGENNMKIIKQFSNWETEFPAFAKCSEFGEGWYLPAKQELQQIKSVKSELDLNVDFLNQIWTSTEASALSAQASYQRLFKTEECSILPIAKF